MNDVMIFVGSAAFLLMLMVWVKNGRVKKLAQEAINLAVKPIVSGNASATNMNAVEDDATWMGDDATIAAISNIALTVISSKARKGPKPGMRYPLVDGSNTMGSNPTYEPQMNLVTIEQDPAISKNHLYIEMTGDDVFMATDLGSRNGTRVNGRFLSPQEPTPIKQGDMLTLGNTSFKIEGEGDEALDSLIHMMPQYQFLVTSGSARGQSFTMNQDTFHIGRNPENDLQLSDRKVSRVHAQVQREGDLVYIINRNPQNKMQVNGREIQKRALEVGDLIKLGDSEIKFEEA